MDGVEILVVQPAENDSPQRLGEWLSEAGARLHVVRPFAGESIPDVESFGGLVVLGGAMGVFDDDAYPWLRDVRSLLSVAVDRSVPTLAICLGAQLLSVATGGQVQNSEVPEVGTFLVAKRDAGWEDPLLQDVPLTPDVLQFHGDEISRIPPTATLLAAAPGCENQAFRVGAAAYGLQFHIETTPETVVSWAAEHPELAEHARPGQLDWDHLTEVHDSLAETWKPVVERFVRWADAPPEERAERTQLPVV